MMDDNIPRSHLDFAWIGVASVFGLSCHPQMEKKPMNTNLPELLARLESTDREGDKLQVVLIGVPEVIHEAKQTLHALRYADIMLWSAIIPMSGSNLSMSVLTRYRSR
jgi:hypothetical protein